MERLKEEIAVRRLSRSRKKLVGNAHCFRMQLAPFVAGKLCRSKLSSAEATRVVGAKVKEMVVVLMK